MILPFQKPKRSKILGKILENVISYPDSVSVTLKVFKEPRMSWRISLGKNGAILRVPIFMTKNELETKIEWSKDWIYEQLKSKPSLKSNFVHTRFRSGDTITITGKDYILEFVESEKIKRLNARLKDNIIIISTPILSDKVFIDSVASLLSKVAAKISEPYIHRRVDELNDCYFQKDIGKITFKYNTSNWGSCSAKSNINLSTRLLRAPVAVIDYVILHELCHLMHMNHSQEYWALVQKIMPSYKIHEKWLRTNSHLCEFKPQSK